MFSVRPREMSECSVGDPFHFEEMKSPATSTPEPCSLSQTNILTPTLQLKVSTSKLAVVVSAHFLSDVSLLGSTVSGQ